jgi:hypothetical protein
MLCLERRRLGMVLWCLLVAVLILPLSSCVGCIQGMGGCPSWVSERETKLEPFWLSDSVMSPDGRTVAFKYTGDKTRPGGWGLIDWRSGKLIRIPNPPIGAIRNVSFFPDGKRLVVVLTARQIAVMDLTTLRLLQVIELSEDIMTRPVFQPGTEKLLYVAGGSARREHLRLVDLIDRTEMNITEERDGFSSLFTPSFVASDEIIFSAMGPYDPQLRQEAKALGAASAGDALLYRLRFGGRPEIQRAGVFQRFAAPKGPRPLEISASAAGSRILFVDLAPEVAGRGSGAFKFEIFKIEHDRIEQITNFRQILRFISVADDGSAVAFGVAPIEIDNFELYVLDLQTGELWRADLRKRLAKDPTFN